jgi:hypothetical protein
MTCQRLVRATFALSTVYTILAILLYIFKRDATIPLTYRVPMYDWAPLKALLEADPLHLDQTQFQAALWCDGPETSPQCSCLYNYSQPNGTFAGNAEQYLAGPTSASALRELGKQQYTDLIDACLSQRTSWRKETCDYWCRIHLVTPVSLACLFTSLFFSRIVQYESSSMQTVAGLLPLALALLMIAAHIGIDLLGGVVATLSVLSALFELSFYSCSCCDHAQVFWNLQRYLIASLAAWAAVTQQARDIYLAACYAVLGFMLGLLAYMQYLMRYRQGCNARVRVVSLYVWMGMCVISGCFLLLVQQHFYPASPIWSSLVAILVLFVVCVQCAWNAPGVYVSDMVQIVVTLAALSFAMLAVTWDALSI